jgi:hypothetical protein
MFSLSPVQLNLYCYGLNNGTLTNCYLWDESAHTESCSGAAYGTTTRTSSALLHPFLLFGATAPIWALAYLHETLRFTSVF